MRPESCLASVFAFLRRVRHSWAADVGAASAGVPASVGVRSRAGGDVSGYPAVHQFCRAGFIVANYGPGPLWSFFFPSSWFVSFCQLLRTRANPAMAELAPLCLYSVLAVITIALGTYAIAYRRHFVRTGELSEGGGVEHIPRKWRLQFLQRMILQTPFQSACFGFTWRTMVRSEAHRLVLTGVGGLALVLASQAMMNAFQGTTSSRQAALTPDALSIPFVMTFLLIIGLRIAFEIAVELRANWVFQFLLDADRQECEPLARRVILTAILPWVLAITFVTYFYFEDWVVASVHTLLVLTWAVLLTNILLIRFPQAAVRLQFAGVQAAFDRDSYLVLLWVSDLCGVHTGV